LDKAIADYTKAIELNPKLAGAYLNRGLTWAQKGELDKAIADYTKAIELNPKFALTYANLGLLLVRNGKRNEAIRNLSKFLKIAPTKARLLFRLLLEEATYRWQLSNNSKKIAKIFKTDMGGATIAKGEGLFIFTYSLWEAGQQQVALANLKQIVQETQFKQKPSKTTKDFFTGIFQLMPKSMAADKQAQALIKEIKEKLR